jgi:hypothetical protein
MTQPHNGKFGPFVFSRWFHTPDAVRVWLGWFNSKGIPAGIVSRAHAPRYAVWRTGVDAVEYGKKPVVTTDMRVEISVNGFEGQFIKRQKEEADVRRIADERQAQKGPA